MTNWGGLKMIKQFALRFFLLSIPLLLLVACSKSLGPEEMPSSIQLGRTYYTQVTMQIEKGAFRTTNYRRGFLIPINSAVELADITEKAIVFRVVSSGQEIVAQNIVGHTNDTTVQAFKKLFGQVKVDLNRFNSLERRNIEQGTVENGMRKDAVIVAIGYPPAIGTVALEGDQWKYWNSRFNTFIVYFKGGKVDRIQN